MNCACGKPLHYTDPSVEAQLHQLTAELGEFIIVHACGINYLVQRHYIALHGIRAEELPELAKQGIIKIREE